MANQLQCDIVSAEASIFSAPVQQVTVSGSEGEMGIRYGHEPLLTHLSPGPVRVLKIDNTEEIFYVPSGFLEVQPDMVTILADEASRARDLDEAEAEKVRQEAERMINEKNASLDYSKALAKIAEANARLRTLKEFKNKKI